MSRSFSLATWLLRLPLSASCIDGDGRGAREDYEPNYYALAEDMKGSHCPYPKLPGWAQSIFRARVRLEYKTTARFFYWQMPRALPDRLRSRRRRLKQWIFDRFFDTRRRGYSWHFHCSLCGAISFFDLAGSQWACKKCGRLNSATPDPAPRISLLDIIVRWERMCKRMDNRPKWVCCLYCGRTDMSDGHDMHGVSGQDISGADLGTTWRCRDCRDPESKIIGYMEHHLGYYTDHVVQRLMRGWLTTRKLPTAIERHHAEVYPF